MSGISTHTHIKYIIPKTGAECNSPAPKKRKKHPDLPECFSHRPAAMPQQVGQAHRSAPHKIPHKSPAPPDFYPSASGHVSRAAPAMQGRGGIVFGFSGTENVSRGDSVPPGITQPSHTSSCSPLRGRASSILMPSFADRPPYSTPYIASVIGMETPCCCARW